MGEHLRFGLARAAAVLLTIALVLAGCRGRERDDALRVTRALEVLRQAPNEQKSQMVELLMKTPCSTEMACATRDKCAGVYRHLADAEDRMRAMSRTLESDPPRTPEAVARLSAELDRAEVEVDGFRQELGTCEQSASLLRRANGI